MFGKKVFCLVVLTLLTATAGFAETNQTAAACTEHLTTCPNCGFTVTNQPAAVVKPVATNNWKASVYGSFAAKSGNASEKSFKYGGDFEKKSDKIYRYKLKADGKYGQAEQQVTDSKAEASGEMRRMLNERWFAYGTLSALHDDLKDLSYRVKTGPGLGYYFIDTEELIADISSGPLYVQEKTSASNDGYLAWRFAQWFDWHITSTFRWWISTELVADTTDIASYNVTFKTGVDNKINDHLSFVVILEDDWDSTPEASAAIKKNDFEISAGLRYNL